MKKIICLLVALLSYSYSFSQINFEKGYFISSNGNKVDCYIKNVDWKNNPTEFEYKLNLDSNVTIGSLKNVTEFGIIDFSKYIRAEVGVDRASLELDNYDSNRIPNFKTEILFLKVLKESNVSLYGYEEGNLNLYFIKVAEGKVEQLVNKPYKLDNSRTGFYQYYKQQLLNSFDCDDAKVGLDKVAYDDSELIKAFDKYYKCSGQKVTSINKNTNIKRFNLSVKPGFTLRSFAFERKGVSAANVDFGNKITARFGVELETVLPFNNGKWALFIEPNFESYNYSKEIPTYGNVKADIRTINAPLGVRYYMFLNKESKLYINLAYNVSVYNKSTASYQNAYTDIEISSGNNLIAGLGYKYKKYSLELRTDFTAANGTNYSDLEVKSSAFSFLLGYTFY